MGILLRGRNAPDERREVDGEKPLRLPEWGYYRPSNFSKYG